jgi:hypothetical protein
LFFLVGQTGPHLAQSACDDRDHLTRMLEKMTNGESLC